MALPLSLFLVRWKLCNDGSELLVGKNHVPFLFVTRRRSDVGVRGGVSMLMAIVRIVDRYVRNRFRHQQKKLPSTISARVPENVCFFPSSYVSRCSNSSMKPFFESVVVTRDIRLPRDRELLLSYRFIYLIHYNMAPRFFVLRR